MRFPACVEETRVQLVQRVNSLAAQETQQGSFALTLGRLARGYALAIQSAVTAWVDGFAVNMLIPGKYAVCDSKMVLTIDAQGERYAIKMHMKNDQKAFFHMRLPAWASSSEILVNGAPTAEYRLVDGCIGIERVWHDGDEIVAVLEQPSCGTAAPIIRRRTSRVARWCWRSRRTAIGHMRCAATAK